MKNGEDLKLRTKRFAIDVIKLVESLPKNDTTKVIGGQLLRSGTSVGANYRSACRARSQADFISKITVVEEDADESQYWIELLVDTDHLSHNTSEKLHDEASQLTAIFTASGKTAKLNRFKNKSFPILFKCFGFINYQEGYLQKNPITFAPK